PRQNTETPGAAPARPADETTRTVSGKVVDPGDRPVPDAEIILQPVEGQPSVAGKTGTDGSFRVTVPLKSPGAWLFARVPGFGSNFLMPATNTPADITFKLIKDAPIRGRVVGTEAKPVAGATVNVMSIQGTDEKSLDQFLAGWLKRDPSDQHLAVRGTVSWQDGPRGLPEGGKVFGATTDADGRFEVANVGAERIVTVSVRAPGIAHSQPLIITR